MMFLSTACNAAEANYGDQIATACGSGQLPMTGYAALVVLLLGLVVLIGGLYLRRHTSNKEKTS